MSIPVGMMPGGGGPSPGGGGMPPGGGQMPGGGTDPGGPEQALQLLQSLQQAPPQTGEDQLFQQASSVLGLLYSRVASRSASAAKVIAECLPKIQHAKSILEKEPARALGGPPDLGSSPFGGTQPAPPMPGF